MRPLCRNALAACTVWLLSGVAASGALIPPLPPNAQPVIVTPGDPAGYVVTSPSPYDAVARIIVSMPGGTYGCSGSLLTGGEYLLTAGHCVSDGSAGGDPTVLSLTATFNDGQVVSGATYYLPPGWDGTFDGGNDLALVQLASSPVGITGYDIWRGADPWGAVIQVAGYGQSGLGATGAVAGTSGTLRVGLNDLGSAYWTLPGNPYAWDFDSGLESNDALCLLVGDCGLGQGALEVMIAPGDSGGPSFYLGSLVGVHSFASTFGSSLGDVDDVLNSTFGEVAGDTRVTAYASWIDSILTPEPGSMILLGTGLAALLWRHRRRQKRTSS